jgi:actin-related protein
MVTSLNVVQAALALISAGKSTGVVVDIGATGSLITPVYEGNPHPRTHAHTGVSPEGKRQSY